MRILGLDLSKRSAGFACWAPGDARVVSGCWTLGSEYTSKGRTFCKLHEEMTAVHRVGQVEAIFYEMPLNLGPGAGMTNIDTIDVLHGLAMHAESWGDAMGCRIIRAVNMATWRRHFIGSMRRGTKTPDLKEFAMRRCRDLGFAPRKHDEAEAIGILDYACDALGILPYWRADNPLVQQFAGAAR